MNCSQCGQPLRDDDLYCEACGYQHAVEDQRGRVNTIKNQIKGIVSARLGSVMFLIMTICFTMGLLIQVVTMINGGFGSIISGMLPLVIMIITAVGMWKSFVKGKKGMLDAPAIKNISLMDAYYRVIMTIAIVLCILFAAVGAVVIYQAMSVLGTMASEEDMASTAGFIGTAIFLAVVGIIIIMLVCYRKVYVNRRRFFSELAHTATSGEYRVEKAPVVGSLVFGILMIISAINSIGFLRFVDSGMDMVLDFMSKFGEVEEELILQMEELSGVLATSLTISGISSVVYGVYYICCAIWISSLHKAERENFATLISESILLDKVEMATREIIIERDAARRMAEKVLLEQASHEDVIVIEEATEVEETSAVE